MNWLKAYAHTHLFYIILITGGVLGFRVWLQEHDARVAAEQVVKQQETVVANLQTQIAATQTQAVEKVQVIKQVVQKATTTTDVVKTLPTLTVLPLNPQPVPNSLDDVQVAALPLLQLAGQAKEDEIQLAACQQVSGLKDQQLTAKNAEIATLKKKPAFFKRLTGTLKVLGVGVGIGVLLASHL